MFLGTVRVRVNEEAVLPGLSEQDIVEGTRDEKATNSIRKEKSTFTTVCNL